MRTQNYFPQIGIKNLFTYTKNKNTNWKKSGVKKSFKNELPECEKMIDQTEVFETGLIILKLSPCLAYFADRVIFENRRIAF